MEIYLYSVLSLMLIAWVWLSSVASYVAYIDGTNEPTQVIGQIFLAWVFPIVGSVFILYFSAQHSPELIPRKLIPWPFKGIVFGKRSAPNRNRDENQDSGIDLRAARSRENRFEESMGSGGTDSD